jgi:5'-3' exonuclease
VNGVAPANRLLLLDGHSLAYRAFYALPAENFSTKTGQTTNAVYGFTSMLINMLRDEEPSHVGVAFDLSRQTFRSEEYAEYKAGRSSTPTEFSGQIPLIHEVLDALRIRYVEAQGYEADDIIATLTTQATAKEMEVVIVSGDRDVFQLVADDVTMVYPVRGVSDVWRMDPAAVLERYLVPPERYSDLAALVGESSDNLPGVPGVGPKTAAKWITTYGDLPGSSPTSTRSAARSATPCASTSTAVLRNRRLNQLVRDVQLDVTVDELERQTWDREQVHEVFDSLEFRVLRERLFQTLDAVTAEAGVGLRRRRRRPVVGRGAGLARRARQGRGAHRRQRRRPVGPRHRRRAGPGYRDRGRARRIHRRRRGRGRRQGGAGGRRLAGRPVPAQGLARRQGAVSRPRRAGLGAGRADQRHGARGIPRQTRPAGIRPGRPVAADVAPRAEERH